jgi:hypothetical protein
VESLLREYPSPYIGDKVLLSKRLNQCTNPVLPEKVHEAVIRIHQAIFRNMRQSVEGNINDYIRLFAEDLGVYSLSLLPHFVHTSNFEQRLMILRLFNHYYLDLGKELIPMLPGLLKALYSVYSATINGQLVQLIELTLSKLLLAAGRRYLVGCTWSLILRYKDCKQSGLKFLSHIIEHPDNKDEDDFEESRGFSDIQIDPLELEHGENDIAPPERGTSFKQLKHFKSIDSDKLHNEDSNSIILFSPEIKTPNGKEDFNNFEFAEGKEEEFGTGGPSKILEESDEESALDGEKEEKPKARSEEGKSELYQEEDKPIS